MFQMSMWEIGLILVIALIVLGPRQLAEAAKVIGKMYRELTKMVDDVRSSVDLDSLTSGPHDYERRRPEGPSKTDHPEMHQVADPNGQSGPDFYAELLEQSGGQAASEREKSGVATRETKGKHDTDAGDEKDKKENDEKEKKEPKRSPD